MPPKVAHQCLFLGHHWLRLEPKFQLVGLQPFLVIQHELRLFLVFLHLPVNNCRPEYFCAFCTSSVFVRLRTPAVRSAIYR